MGALHVVADDDPDHALADERREGRRLDLGEVGHHGVELEDDHLLLHEQLVDRVERADGRRVAGAQHETHAPLRRRPVGRRHRRRQGLRGDRPIHPDVGVHPQVGETVQEVGRHDPGHDAPVGQGPHATGDARHACPDDPVERVAVEADAAQEDVRPDDGLLGRVGALGVQALVERAQARPAVDQRQRGRQHLVEQLALALGLVRTHASAFARSSATASSQTASGVASGTGIRGTYWYGPAGITRLGWGWTTVMAAWAMMPVRGGGARSMVRRVSVRRAGQGDGSSRARDGRPMLRVPARGRRREG